MGNIDTYNSLPISYNHETNELIINLPKDLKIKFTNSIDITTEGEFNLFSYGEMNLLSLFHNMHFDTLNAAIHLNSRKAKQLFFPNDYQFPIDIHFSRSIADLNLSRQRKLENLASCLHKMLKH